ncbi:hypothetical protein [Stutzerimonas stutzeri]|uniref:Uncharacterized protein n=1 Tax=Stutzerimonas stutzeri TaxID=316 RepID=A0AA42TGD5_STUST|nr:hypothetical protein [Stutzerimonas stutzeri]MDH1236519.1 hypothetical protein [Stutzerimonas stutzeri]
MRSTFPIGTVYYGRQLYARYEGKRIKELPDGAYIYEIWFSYTGWYTADFCPCLVDDVPPEIRAMHLLLG